MSNFTSIRIFRYVRLFVKIESLLVSCCCLHCLESTLNPGIQELLWRLVYYTVNVPYFASVKNSNYRCTASNINGRNY
jgi:hypothetical protein